MTGPLLFLFKGGTPKMDNELQHYGVKGMKWGVRKNDKVVLRKGSTVQRISANKNEKNRGRTYISFKDIDNLQYEAMAGEDGLYWTGSGETPYGYKVKLKVTNDIIAPSYNETVEAFIKTVENTPIKDLATDIYGRKEDMRTPAQKKDYKKNTKEFIKT